MLDEFDRRTGRGDKNALKAESYASVEPAAEEGWEKEGVNIVVTLHQ